MLIHSFERFLRLFPYYIAPLSAYSQAIIKSYNFLFSAFLIISIAYLTYYNSILIVNYLILLDLRLSRRYNYKSQKYVRLNPGEPEIHINDI